MEGRSLSITGANTTFFNKITNTITKLLIPTKIGINSFIISIKRNAVIKAFEEYTKENGDTDENEKKSQEAYAEYLESLDKYVLDTIYKKVKNGTATEFEKQALSRYYRIIQLKEPEYTEYRYRKQKYLLELDYESIKSSKKPKNIEKYNKFYMFQMDSLYKSILRNYSIKLADNTNKYDDTKEAVYTNIFNTIEEYITNILDLKIKNTEKNEELIKEYQKYETFEVGKLDKRDNIEKDMILLSISRKLFTHSIPLIVAEQCYEKLLNDARTLVQDTKIATKRERAYEILIMLMEEYNIKLLATKVYWDDFKERDEFKKFLESYKQIQPLKEIDYTEYARKKETIFLKRDISRIENSKKDYSILIKYYKRKLVDFGTIREIKNVAKSTEGKYIKRRVKECINWNI